MTLAADHGPEYLVVIDAVDGQLLFRKSLTTYQSQPVRYVVYGGDSPAPLSPTTATDPGQNVQGLGVARDTFDIIREIPEDNLGWITDGQNTTNGNNADVGLDLGWPDGIDWNGYATGSPWRVFDSPYTPRR